MPAAAISSLSSGFYCPADFTASPMGSHIAHSSNSTLLLRSQFISYQGGMSPVLRGEIRGDLSK